MLDRFQSLAKEKCFLTETRTTFAGMPPKPTESKGTFKKDIKTKNEENSRTLYLRLKTKVTGDEDVKPLIDNFERVVIGRKPRRHCFVIFATQEERESYFEKLKTNEDVFVGRKRLLNEDPEKKVKKNKKKIKIRKEDKEELFVDKVLLVRNVPTETKAAELKAEFPGCRTLVIFKRGNHNPNRAKLKMESPEIVMEYIKKIRKPPKIRGHKLRVTTPILLRKLKLAKRQRRQLKKKREQKEETTAQ